MKQILLRLYFVIQKIVFPQVDKKYFDSIVSQGKILEKDEKGIKVVEVSEQEIVKIFRLKRVYSSALIFPYAYRFKNNAMKLLKKGIETIHVIKVEYCRQEQRHLVRYEKIPGNTIRDLIENNSNDDKLINKTIEFIVKLHEKGVYFRSLHFGNIVVTDTGGMALIDIADLIVYPWSLTFNQRVRNWKHLFKYSMEKGIINSYGRERFLDEYSDGAKLSLQQKEYLKKELI